jgi:serine phosphatase RsbU (regulator of sigma subunit)/tetratricopeptide (TPR) repeat protein
VKLLTNIGFLFLFFVLTTNICIAQNFADKQYYLVDSLEMDKVSDTDKILLDSCLTIFHNAKNDTDKVNAITIIVEQSWDDKIWPKYNLWNYHFIETKLKEQPSEKIKKKLYFSLASAINNIGYYNSTNGNIPEALKYYHKSLKLQESLKDTEGAATSFNNIGAIYNKQGDIPKALEFYHKSLKKYEQLNNQEGLAQTLNNLGHIYQSQNEADLALEYFHKSLKIFQELDNKRGIATLLNSIGYVYFKKQNLDKALSYYNQALTIRQETNDQKGIASTFNNMAATYEQKQNTSKAIDYYLKCLKIYENISDKNGLSIALNNIGRIYLGLNQLQKAKQYSLESFKIAKELSLPDNIKGTAQTLSLIYEKEGNGIEALKMYKLHILMRDSVNNEETAISAVKEQSKYEYEKNKAIDDAEYGKVIAIKNKEKEKQLIISVATALLLILVIVFLIFVFNRLKMTRKQKLVIEAQNREIVDSINYAKRIQEAILPDKNFVDKCLPNNFVLYKPKAIVAGDFYWVQQQNDNILFAAADCTGHGVPGAMVSVVCYNAMDRAIREFNLSTPGEILDKTRLFVEIQLNKSHQKGIINMRDGMDIAFCSLNKLTNELEYAGAHNPLWIIRNGTTIIEELRATRQSIGRIENPKPFDTHKIKLNQGDTFYIFSDGFADQFGGESGKKMMSKRFKELLINIQNETMVQQLKLIDAYFETWKGNLDQIDDVCIIGVRI